MRVLTRALATLGLAALAGAPSLSAQSLGVGSNRFYIGGSAGIINFATASQTRGSVGMAGGNLLVTGKRAGLLIGVDLGLGTNHVASMVDPVDTLGTVRGVTFDRINRYYAMLMAYPLQSHVQPFIGIGWGFQTLSNIQVQGSFPDAKSQTANQAQAEDLGSYGFMQATAGVEIRVGVANVYGSLSAATAGNRSALIEGSVYTAQAGVRLTLGKSHDDD